MIAELCGIRGTPGQDFVEVVAPPVAAHIRQLVRDQAAFGGLVEPDMPLAKLTLPRDAVDRAILALVARGAPRALLFVRGDVARVARVKDERALDFTVALLRAATDDPWLAVLAAAGAPMAGKALLREVRARRGGASASDAKELGRALVRAWSAGIVDLR